MSKNDFKVTISVVDGEFDIDATGNVIDIVQGAILAVASFMEIMKKDDISDAELEDSVIREFRRALEYAKEHRENCEVGMI